MTHPIADGSQVLRGLWLARELPFPADMGDRIYSSNLAKALAECGVDLTFVGLRPERGQEPPDNWPITWRAVAGRPRKPLRALFSTMPLVAAAFSTRAYRNCVRSMMREHWDFVVLDQYGLGWALDIVRSAARADKRTIVIHVAHDHEASVCESLYRGFQGSPLKRLALWQNYLKAKVFERELASRVDLVTSITEEDAARFIEDDPDVRTVILKPGYSGSVSSRTVITEQVARRVVLIGSFRWIAKQENLRQFIQVADPIFALHGIEFVVVGAMPTELSEEIRSTAVATKIVGFVDRLEPVLETARMAVVPEAIGGGFKLKFLDYVFGRVPVATLTQAAAGIPDGIRRAMLCRATMAELASGIAETIDDFPELNAMQETALRNATALFRWSDRGRDLLRSIQESGRSPGSGFGRGNTTITGRT